MAQLLTGPRLGPWYDFLTTCRPSPPVSGEITLIETNTGGTEPPEKFFPYFIEGGTAASVLQCLTEVEASALILQIPVAGLSSGMLSNTAELIFRFDEEFGLLEGNILNLFEAIRLGSIRPEEAAAYVGELLNLTEQGKDRLLALFMSPEETRVFEKAIAVFGRVWKTGGAGYFITQTDPDGVLRRIAPVLLEEGEPEHPVYTALKDRYKQPAIEHTADGLILRLVNADGETRFLPLDKRGALLIEKPGKERDFKRVPLSLILDYEEADKELYRILTAAAPLGIYGGLNPEKYPPVLYEYALSIREDLLREPGEEKKLLWIEGRKRYFSALEDFCYGPGEMALISGYETRIAVEVASAEREASAVQELRNQRDELIRTFRDIREKYNSLEEIRGTLKSLLYGSFCILGPGGQGPTETEASAILANSLLSGSVIRPAPLRQVLFWSLAAACILCLCLVKEEPLPSLGIGFFLSLFIGVVFSGSFVLSAYWIDPFIPLTAAGGASLASVLFSLIMNRRLADQIRRLYGNSLPPAYFKTLLRAGARRDVLGVCCVSQVKPPKSALQAIFYLANSESTPVNQDFCGAGGARIHKYNRLLGDTRGIALSALEPVTVSAAVITIRNDSLAVQKNRNSPMNPREAARDGAAFHEELSRWCAKAGGIMAGWEGDTALMVFGSPLERMVMRIRGEPMDSGSANPVSGALKFLDELLKGSPIGGAWFFGIDAGECAFIPIPGSGYRVYGPAVTCSRFLAKLASRYKIPILVTRTIREKAGTIPARAIRLSAGQQGSRIFYTLLIEALPKHE
ncbi:MAG: hypothetical protein LBC60_00515 [Spirochaetaceae bacterium]|nr:hypothetical protein [Spirochaetaceae bacterium]